LHDYSAFFSKISCCIIYINIRYLFQFYSKMCSNHLYWFQHKTTLLMYLVDPKTFRFTITKNTFATPTNPTNNTNLSVNHIIFTIINTHG